MSTVKIWRGEVLLGTCSRNDRGWIFIPNVSGRTAGRKRWPTWEEALPRWVSLFRSEEVR